MAASLRLQELVLRIHRSVALIRKVFGSNRSPQPNVCDHASNWVERAAATAQRFIRTSSKLSSTLPTTVQAASSARSAPGGAAPSGSVAILRACSGDWAYVA